MTLSFLLKFQCTFVLKSSIEYVFKPSDYNALESKIHHEVNHAGYENSPSISEVAFFVKHK